MPSKTWSRCLAAAMVCIAVAAATNNAAAQSTGMFGSGSALSGSSGFGAGTTGSSGSSAFGSNALPSNSLPSTALPSTALPSNGLPGATGATGQAGQAGQAGAAGQRAGLVGQASTRLAGVAAAGPAATGTQMQQGQNRNAQRGGQRGGQGQNQNQNNQQQQRTVRPQLVVAFNPPLPTSTVMNSNVSTRLKKISKFGYEGVTVEIDGRHAIIRGQVDSPEAKRMAQMLVKLEPGIKTVQNDLTVKGPPAPPVPSE